MKFNKILLSISQVLIYTLIIFLFLDKGNSFREIGIYLPPILLLIGTILTRENPVDIKNSIFILLVILSISGIIASVVSPEPLYSLKWFNRTYLKLLLFFIAFTYIFRTSQQLEKLSNLFILLNFLFTALTIYTFYIKIILENHDFGTTIRMYIYPLETFFPFTLYFIFLAKKRFLKYVSLVLLPLCLIAIILTGSRGGWISVIFGISVWLVGYLYISKGNIKKISISAISIGLSIFIVISSMSPSYLKIKFDQIIKGDTSQRKEFVWPIAIESYENLPLINKIFGNGLGRMTYLEDFKKYYFKRFGIEPQEVYSPHNIYLYTLYKQGIFGLTALLTLFFTSIVKLIKSFKIEQPVEMKFFSLSLISILTILMIHGLVEDTPFTQLLLIIPLIGANTRYLRSMKNA